MRVESGITLLSRVAWRTIAISTLLSSCSTTPAPPPPPLPSAEQIAGRVRAIEVEQAYADKGGIHLKYQGSTPDTTRPVQLYAQVRWVAEDGDEVAHAPLQALPLEFQAETDWKTKPEALPSVPVYDVDDFRRLRTQTRRAATSREEGTGIVITVGEEELFIYYDEHGQLRGSLLEDRPPDFRITKVYSRKEYVEVILRTTQDYLASLDSPAHQALFVTGEQGYHAWPFFYVDLDRELAAPLVLAPPTQGEQGVAASYQLRIARHVLVSSPILSALRNPVSSLDRLFHLMLTNVYDTMRPIPDAEDAVIPPLSTGPGMDLEAWEERLDSLVGSPASSGTIRFLIDGDQVAPRTYDAISRAKDSVHLRVFVFDNDDHAVKHADLLKRRSGEIDVRVLVDGLGTFGAAMHNPPSMPQDFQPPPSIVNYLEQESEVQVRVQTNPFFATDHAKTLVVDHTVAFTGGLNVGREYRHEWHDLGMEVHGPVVDVIRKAFHKRWHHSGPLGDLGYLFHLMKPTNCKLCKLGSVQNWGKIGVKSIVVCCSNSHLRCKGRFQGPGVSAITSLSKFHGRVQQKFHECLDRGRKERAPRNPGWKAAGPSVWCWAVPAQRRGQHPRYCLQAYLCATDGLLVLTRIVPRGSSPVGEMSPSSQAAHLSFHRYVDSQAAAAVIGSDQWALTLFQPFVSECKPRRGCMTGRNVGEVPWKRR